LPSVCFLAKTGIEYPNYITTTSLFNFKSFAMRYFFFIAIALFAFTSLHAQSMDEETYDIGTPSPNAAALGKFVETPTNNHTGAISVDLPITSISIGSYTHDVAISYHGGGIKVDEEASNVGLGWVLKAGGMISREVRGAPDERVRVAGTYPCVDNRFLGWYGDDVVNLDYDNYVHRDYVYCVEEGIVAIPLPYPAPYTKECPMGGYLTCNAAHPNVDVQFNRMLAAAGLIDTEPDFFTVVVGGISAKFYFNAQQEAVFINGEAIKVEVVFNAPSYASSPGSFSSFTVTGPDGITYVFGNDAIERSQILDGSTSPWVTNAWLLKEVRVPDSKMILAFEYETEKYQKVSLPAQTEVFPIEDLTDYSFNICDSPHPHNMSFDGQAVLYQFAGFNSSLVETKRLEKIVNGLDEIDFIYGAPREDVYVPLSTLFTGFAPLRLSSVVKSVLGSQNELITSFSQSYFVSQDVSFPGSTSSGPALINSSASKRLRLNSFITSPDPGYQQDQNAAPCALLTSFEYYDDTSLPIRFSLDKDYWGYYTSCGLVLCIGKKLKIVR
jgi:hypothetical protein